MQSAGDFERIKAEAVELAQRAEVAEESAADGEARVAELSQGAADVSRLEKELAELTRRAEDAEARVAGLDARIVELTQRAETAEVRASEMAGELSGARESLTRANAEVENSSERLLLAQSRISELQRELFARDASHAVLRERTDKLRGEAQDASSLAEELARERDARQASVRELEELQSVHADCDFAFSTLRDQIVALRRRVAEVESGAAPRPRLAVARKNGTTGTATGVASAPVAGGRGPTRPASLLDAPSRLPDDLKQINGVGFRAEKQLNDLGVFYFQQLANLSAEEAAWLDDQLGEFRGKLYRDRWIDQANDLIAGRRHVKEY